MKPSRATLALSWSILAAPWGILDPLGRLGRISGPSWHALWLSWGVLWPSWGVLWPSSLPKATERQTEKPYISFVFSILSRSAAFLKPPWLNMASFTVLVPSWAHLGAILGRLGRVLERRVAVLGRLVAALASQKPPNGGPKSIIFHLFFNTFALRSHPEANLLQHGPLHRPGAVLGASWGRLGAILARLGASCGRLGASWGQLGLPKPSQKRSKIDPKIDPKIDRKTMPSWTPLGSQKP